MGKKHRSPRRLVIEDKIEVTEEPAVNNTTGGIPVTRPKPPPQNPNSTGGLLNSILTTLLNQEYVRLQQQLMNIKQQLDAQKLINDSIVDGTLIDNNFDNSHNESTEAKPLSVSASQQETNE